MHPTTKRAMRRAATLAGLGVGARALVRRGRRQRLEAAFRGIHDTVLPAADDIEPLDQPGIGPVAHAPGHRHLPPDASEDAGALASHERGAPWSESPAHWGAVHHRERS